MNIESIKNVFGEPLPAHRGGPIAWLFGKADAAAGVRGGEPRDDLYRDSGPHHSGSNRRYDLRRFTPREMSELSLHLYVSGLLGYEDYAALAFQPEMHPDYDTTIGALTGTKAQPDRPRDFIELWEDRLRFERTHNPENQKRIGRIKHILRLLRRVADNPETLG